MERLKQRLVSFWFGLKRSIIKIMISKSSDHIIGLSLAIGSFIAVFPTPGVSIFITLFVAAVFKKLNRVALLLSQAIWNAFTVVPIYWLSFEVGKLLFPSTVIDEFRWEWLTVAVDFIKRFMIGNLFVSIPLALLTYYFSKWAVVKLRERRKIKIFKKKTKNNQGSRLSKLIEV